mmetsp:Transcript_44532/g.89954  ORF Transcript_44532/g.89954 Transcript_44532/m.89954 type:complete len:114 (+) Transcript_44532:1961-2302(+)
MPMHTLFGLAASSSPPPRRERNGRRTEVPVLSFETRLCLLPCPNQLLTAKGRRVDDDDAATVPDNAWAERPGVESTILDSTTAKASIKATVFATHLMIRPKPNRNYLAFDLLV